ncbi:hypothetical protein B0H14DRAFT_3032059 [Mycena olivaceomarginata]|nr:hypothetical protein B0H14DRAFT_3032059 [Mycena olivaceomarginata]
MAVLRVPTSLFLVALAGFCAAQTITSTSLGTLYGIAYPGDIFNSIGDVWFDNQPEVSILGTGSGGQTTFSYHDTVTDSLAQDGILVQDGRGIYFSAIMHTGNGSYFPAVVQTCQYGATATAGPAVCVVNINDALTYTFTWSVTPILTYVAAVSTLTVSPSTPTLSSPSLPTSSSPSPPTSPSPSPIPVHKVPVGAIVGGVIGGIAVVVTVLGVLFWRRHERLKKPVPEKDELDPDPSTHNPDLQPTPFLPHNLFILSDSSYVFPSSSEAALDASTAAPAVTAAPTTSDSPSETRGERRQRLKQMQDTVQQLQRNLSISNSDSPATPTAVESESEVVAMRRQMDMLLGEVERLRLALAADHALPAYEE